MIINKIVHNKPYLDNNEIEITASIIQTGLISQGNKTSEFEENLCNYLDINSDSAVAVSNGTSALYIALQILNLPKYSEVIIPSYICSALLNAIYMSNLTPIIVDINPCDFNIDINLIDAFITNNTKVIIVPHIYGMPSDIKALDKYKKKGVFIIEDCATAIGAKIGGQFVGTFGDISVFSFYASKFITCGNGGMIVSLNKELINKARDYREFDGVVNYLKRFNFQISDIQSGIGIEQLKKITFFLKRRKSFSDQYIDICNKKGWDYQKPLKNDIEPNNYRFVLKLLLEDRIKLQKYLNDNNVGSIIPIENFELLHNYLKLDSNKYKVSELISNNSLSIPIYPALSDTEFDYIIKLLNNF